MSAISDKLAIAGDSVNDSLLSRVLKHGGYLERYKAAEVRRMLAMLNRDLIPDVTETLATRLARVGARGYDSGFATTQRYRDMLQALNGIADDQFGAILDKLSGDMNGLASVEADFATASLERATRAIELDFVSPAPETLNAIVESYPFEGRILSEWFDDLSGSVQRRLTTQLGIGMSQGETTDQLIARFQSNGGAAGVARRGLEAVVRTATTHVSAHAREATYEENDDLIEEVMFVATLDTRTTAICRSLDGQTFPIGEGPRPPLHFGCRSTTVPIVKSWKDIGLDFNAIPAAQRASMNGAIPASINYEQWLRSQPESVQIEALGPARYELFKNGSKGLGDLVDAAGRLLTLDQLRRAG